MEVVVTAGAIGRAKLQSNEHHQQTNTILILLGTMQFTCHCLIKRILLTYFTASNENTRLTVDFHNARVTSRRLNPEHGGRIDRILIVP